MKDIVLQAYFESLQKLIHEQTAALRARDDLIQLQERQIVDLQGQVSILQAPREPPRRRRSAQ